MYLGFLQYLQFTYQKGCLYRLRSLGERNDMDITIDGFHSWMWKGKFVKSIHTHFKIKRSILDEMFLLNTLKFVVLLGYENSYKYLHKG